jgi:hypothetical protein
VAIGPLSQVVGQGRLGARDHPDDVLCVSDRRKSQSTATWSFTAFRGISITRGGNAVSNTVFGRLRVRRLNLQSEEPGRVEGDVTTNLTSGTERAGEGQSTSGTGVPLQVYGRFSVSGNERLVRRWLISNQAPVAHAAIPSPWEMLVHQSARETIQ